MTSNPLIYHADLPNGEVDRVLEEIRVYEVAISAVDAEVQGLVKQAAILRHKKQTYLDLIAKCRGRITLALRMPDEILATIFNFCSDTWDRAPLVLSQVCRKWRQAAMTPIVFSHVHLSSDSLDPIAKVKLWLERARDTGLHISVDILFHDEQFIAALELLVARSAQWCSFRLEARSTRLANEVLSHCVGNMPRLINGNVYSRGSGGPHVVLNDWGLSALGHAFAGAPNLRSLEVKTNRLPPTYPSQISHLTLELGTLLETLHHSSETEPFVLLSNLQSLTSLTLVAPLDYFGEYNEDIPIIDLPRLKSLTLNTNRAFARILQYVYAPCLETLRIRSIEAPLSHPYELTAVALLHFLDRSTPPLTRFELHDVDLPAGDFMRVFERMPSLRSLYLHETEIPDEVIATLCGPLSLCPQLTELDLRWCEQLSGRALVDLVASRSGCFDTTNEVCPISFVRVVNCALVEEDDVMELARSTMCSVYANDIHDYCRNISKSCCDNARYRHRMMFRRHGELRLYQRQSPLNLIIM